MSEREVGRRRSMRPFDDIVTCNPRQATRLAIDYFLRQVLTISQGFEGDFLLGLVFVATSAANERRIMHASQAARPAPISASALARSLSLPFETTRRKVIKLIDTGLCARVDSGLILTREASESRRWSDIVCRTNADLRTLVSALVRDGYIATAAGLRLQTFDEKINRDPRRAARLATETFLRGVATLSWWFKGDFKLGLVFVGALAANNRRITRTPEIIRRYSELADVPPDDCRAPVSTSALARSLGLPFETTRREVNRLIEEGQCRRTRGGLVITEEALANEGQLEMIKRTNADLRTLVGLLGRESYIG